MSSVTGTKWLWLSGNGFRASLMQMLPDSHNRLVPTANLMIQEGV